VTFNFDPEGLYMVHVDIVGKLQSMEPKLPMIWRKDIREAIQEIVQLREELKSAGGSHERA